jgi:hypothetical protein
MPPGKVGSSEHAHYSVQCVGVFQNCWPWGWQLDVRWRVHFHEMNDEPARLLRINGAAASGRGQLPGDPTGGRRG